jgi:hypothetical protein
LKRDETMQKQKSTESRKQNKIQKQNERTKSERSKNARSISIQKDEQQGRKTRS